MSLNDYPLGIIAAGKSEIKNILDNPLFRWQKRSAKFYFSPLNIYLLLSGPGPGRAAIAAKKILDQVSAVIIFGTAGGLGESQIGEIFLVKEFIDQQCGWQSGLSSSSTINKEIELTCACLGIKLKKGRLLTVPQPLTVQSTIRKEIENYGADLVDMESAGIAYEFSLKGKRISAVRYITDLADSETEIQWKENVKKASPLFNLILERLVRE